MDKNKAAIDRLSHCTSLNINTSLQASLWATQYVSDYVQTAVSDGLEALHKLSPIIQNAVASSTNLMIDLAPSLAHLSELASSLPSTLSTIYSSIDEQKILTALLPNYIKWGEYGWSLPPNAPIRYFRTPPIDFHSANQQMIKFCTPAAIESMFHLLRDNSEINITHLDESIECFHHQLFQSCANDLFPLIDVVLIKYQKTEPQKSRKSGSSAAKKLLEQVNCQDNQRYVRRILRVTNVLTCIKTIFKYANDFCAESEIINRNFIAHGMNHRPVTREDCIQLYVLLFNLTSPGVVQALQSLQDL